MASLYDTAAVAGRDRPFGASALARWAAAQIAAERERWALWLPVAFAAGVGVYFGLDREPPVWLAPTSLALAAVLGVAGRRRTGPLVLALALGAAAAGFGAAQARSALVAAPVLDKRLGPVWLSGQIVALEPRAKRARLTLRRLNVGALPPERTPDKVRVSVSRGHAGLLPGNWVRLRAVLRPPPEPAAPGAFDFARRAYFEGLGAVGFAFGAVRRIEAPPGAQQRVREAGALGAWRLWWARLRYGVARRVLDAVPGEAGAVAAALMTGERGAIPAPVMRAMRDSGLAHLLAISGLHVGLVAGLLFLGVRALLALVPRLALDYPIKKWAAVAAALGAFAYLLLTGATIPTQRAFLMVALALLAVMLDRTALTLRLVAWAAFVILALAPESLLSASFQLSFAAVTALVAGYEVVRDRRVRLVGERGIWTKIGVYVAGVALTSLIAGLATAPFAIHHFNRIAWYALAANLLAVPLTALWIMPWALAAFCLLPFGAERIALIPMGWGIDGVLAVAAWVAAWPGAASIVPAMPTAGLALTALGGVWLCLWRRPWRLLGLVPILAGLLTVPLSAPPDILVSGDGRLFGVRAPDGRLLLSTELARRFDADVWRRRLGRSESEVWPRAGAAAGGRLRCDPLGCIYRAGGQVVALVRDNRALLDDCRVATVLVSREPVRRGACPGPRLAIDRFDLWRRGAHAIWLAPHEVRVETVAGHRGRRPWVRPRGRD
ncbi:MAG: ComEC/Rec2 family competence protein [Kiloniellaceae bacterium]